jgi:hypothetical protein
VEFVGSDSINERECVIWVVVVVPFEISPLPDASEGNRENGAFLKSEKSTTEWPKQKGEIFPYYLINHVSGIVGTLEPECADRSSFLFLHINAF